MPVAFLARFIAIHVSDHGWRLTGQEQRTAKGYVYLKQIDLSEQQRNFLVQQFEPDTLVRNPVGNPVVASVTVKSDARSVWNVVGDFAGFATFIPALAHIEMTGEGVRSVRKKLFKDGNVVIEQLNTHDDQAMAMTWSLLYTSLNIGNLWAVMQVVPDGDNQSQATWTIIGQPHTGSKEDVPAFEAFLQGFADDAMKNVQALFNG
ncbi:SRPBCC family protein [Pseudomonas fluorescens]|uniref:SRPBCC family protein n=1 Tax=Pseudomonas fluorescens TaxID=294 RepID=A0A2N1E6Y9_PSEFL|nr:SRPBCC family protein [Pseudomonas fluorescens]TKK28801.1 SRPBCC family protein [Pseudomonas sp. CFBP13528]MBD8774520.1 SRPBCC family protein [Pseudomonas fluorescens]MBD8780023.1 SRPBCC family protein [Pseudomonas fluorescens]MBD8797030.1 SRPBCC family protein [Pseudomonas fluorescens]